MMTKRLLITTAAGLALCLGALAGPADEERLSELEAKAHEQSERAEEKIHHLEEAARHLEAIGMADEAARLQDQAALRRTDQRKRLAELELLIRRETEIRRQRELAGLVQEAIEQLRDEWRGNLPPGHPPAERNDEADERARAEAHRRQTLQTWRRIEEAARGERPLPPQASDRPDRNDDDDEQARAEAHHRQTLQTWRRIEEAARGERPLPPQAIDRADRPDRSPPRQPDASSQALPETDPPAGRTVQGEAESPRAVLEQILRTLQRIERKMEEK